ncbi:MAG: hypothetical protein ACLQUW_00055 [Desulfobaccales bacterium]
MHTKLKTTIQKYAYAHPLEERFSWGFALDDLPSEVVCLLSKSNASAFENNIALKKCLRSHLRCNGYPMEYWIIQKWGGINGFKKNSINDQKITILYEQLDEGSFSRNIFEVISSLSKIASFYNPSEYAIYDSRSIFSLNWLLLKSGATDGFFHIPAGRNTEIAKYDLETIIRLKCGERRGLFVDNKIAYFEYCNLLKKLSLAIWNNEELRGMPFYLEMLLFILGPQEIVDDIKKSTRLDIATTP